MKERKKYLVFLLVAKRFASLLHDVFVVPLSYDSLSYAIALIFFQFFRMK
jgi:hypothetical protein